MVGTHMIEFRKVIGCVNIYSLMGVYIYTIQGVHNTMLLYILYHSGKRLCVGVLSGSMFQVRTLRN